MLRKIVLLLLTLVLIAGCSKKNEKEESSIGCGTDEAGCEIINVTPEVKAYRNLISNFEEITLEDAATRITNGGSLTIYYGFETCPWCQELLPLLSEYATKTEVFYVNMKPDSEDVRKEEHPLYQEYLKNYQLIYPNADEEKIYAPTIAKFAGGELEMLHVGTVEGHDAHERKMTDEEKEILKNDLHEFFKDVIGEVK